MSFTFSVTITPPPSMICKSELKALLETPTTFFVRAESADEACDLAQLAIPWVLDPPYFEVRSRWVRNPAPLYASNRAV